MRNAKKIVASLMATMTVVSVMSAECLAAGNGRIGVKSYDFYYGTQTYYVGDCNADGQINLADLVCLRLVGDYGSAVWNAEKVWDCNGDGYINSKDAEALQSYLLGH
jgi:hypothetical protein